MSRVTPDVMPAQTDYKIRDEYAPKYRYLKVPLNNLTGSQVSITAGAQQLLEWKLPIGTYNLARSYVSYNMKFPATEDLCAWCYEDVFELAQTVFFGTAGGLGICNLEYASNYSRIIRQQKTKLNKFQSHDVQSTLYPSVIQVAQTNLLPTSITIPNSNLYGIDGASASRIEGFDSLFPSNSNEVMNIFAFNVDTDMYRPRQIRLGEYYDTFLSVDRDHYWPIEMYLRMLSNPGSKMGWYSETSDNPMIGAVLPSTITISNIYLYLAVEQNEIISRSIEAKVRSGGMKVQIPYTQAFRNPGVAGSTSLNLQIQLTSQYGKRLKRMIWSIFNATDSESRNTAYDNINFNGRLVTSYQTFLDSRPLQDAQLSCYLPSDINSGVNGLINADDWRENSRFLEGSVLINQAVYQLCWHHNDYFYEVKEHNIVSEDNIDEGLDMDTTHLWTVQATIPSTIYNGVTDTSPSLSAVMYNYATFVRDLTIHPVGAPSLDR